MIKQAEVKDLNEVKPKQNLKTDEDQPQEKGVGNSMINEMEKIGQKDNQDISLEYFVEGQKKFYVPYHTHHNLADNFSKEILMAQNMLLPIKLKDEMGKRIDELELNEIILKIQN